MKQTRKNRIFAVVVTYHPDPEILGQLVHALELQVESILIVDNGSCHEFFEQDMQRALPAVKILLLGENKGIAFAHNRGIEMARSLGADFVLLMDQDSIPAPDMVDELLSAVLNHPFPAASGPCYLDSRQKNPPPFIRIKGLNLERCACLAENSVIAVDYLVSSGCLVPVSVFDLAGKMRENLFIDYVDIEWGLRAKRHGFQCYGVCAAKMGHSLGESPIEFFGQKFPVHSPLRHYYYFRNALLLYQEKELPLNWKIVDGLRLFLKFGFYIIFAKPHIAHLKMITLGILHGLLGKTGKLKKG